jgi:hypothetical protein
MFFKDWAKVITPLQEDLCKFKIITGWIFPALRKVLFKCYRQNQITFRTKYNFSWKPYLLRSTLKEMWYDKRDQRWFHILRHHIGGLIKARIETFVYLILLPLYFVKPSGTLVLNFDCCPREKKFKFLVPLNAHAGAHEKIIWAWILNK